MKESIGNIWTLRRKTPVVVTTNGFVKRNGKCVMGRGIAKQAAERYPELPKMLGDSLRKYGNRPFFFKYIGIITLPVKPAYGNAKNAVKHMQHFTGRIPGWAVRADLDLIIESCKYLPSMANKFGWQRVRMPRPGCGAGELSWDIVKPAISFLDNRFIVFTYR